jgi:hypothetical protein
VRPRLSPELRQPERAPQPRAVATASLLPTGVVERTEDDLNDWQELARPWRMGLGGVAVAARLIERLSNREVVANICDLLRRAVTQLGADADIVRISALEAAALALCPEVGAAPKDAGKAKAADGGGHKDARASEPASDEPETQTEDDPPKRPPDK